MLVESIFEIDATMAHVDVNDRRNHICYVHCTHEGGTIFERASDCGGRGESEGIVLQDIILKNLKMGFYIGNIPEGVAIKPSGCSLSTIRIRMISTNSSFVMYKPSLDSFANSLIIAFSSA